ncbi:bifunctional ornithine acetyltransferase/N-acetylglutamate synthase, partial [Salmonella sp. SAL4445]|uniref:bifunctional ornithine acetyltransferase/N-acetylglutamate synthase n=1 Tax=Salmonella sp. SAL4445 TaxID=3159900 RepID=UPI0039782772
CKGSGMIMPQMATMIATIVTDCAITPEALTKALTEATAVTFNRLTVDNDMSTNDAVFALANGLAKNKLIDGKGAAYDAFADALQSICG